MSDQYWNNLTKIQRKQNHGTRIITGSMISTPIHAMETITGLESIEHKRNIKIQQQAKKDLSLSDHPMHNRINTTRKPDRLKRKHFI